MMLLPLIGLVLATTPKAAAPATTPAKPAVTAPAPRQHFDVPHAIEAVEVPGELQAVGVPIRLRAVRSSDKLPLLYEYFAREFRKRGLYLPPPERLTKLSNNPQITAYDPTAQISYTVIFQLNRDQSTTVILGEADVGNRKEQAGSDFAPLFPGATHVLRSNVEAAKSLSYVADAKPQEVEAFYRDTLIKDGYRETDPLLFQKDTTQIRVLAKANGSATSKVMLFQQFGVSGSNVSDEAMK